MDPEKNKPDFDRLAEEFVGALKRLHGSGKSLTARVLSKELSNRPALQQLFEQKISEVRQSLPILMSRKSPRCCPVSRLLIRSV